MVTDGDGAVLAADDDGVMQAVGEDRDASDETVIEPAPAGKAMAPGGRRMQWLAALRERAGRAVVAIAIAVPTVAAAVVGYQWHSAQQELDRMSAQATESAAASAVAREYTKRSLTYDYRKLDDFFAGVEQGTTKELRAEYEKLRPDMTAIMTQAQVVATGDVLGTSLVSSSEDQYEFGVFATQKTKNLQQVEPTEFPTLLRVIVVRDGDGWVVSKYADFRTSG